MFFCHLLFFDFFYWVRKNSNFLNANSSRLYVSGNLLSKCKTNSLVLGGLSICLMISFISFAYGINQYGGIISLKRITGSHFMGFVQIVISLLFMVIFMFITTIFHLITQTSHLNKCLCTLKIQ